MALEDENNAHGVLLLNSNAMGKTIFKTILKNFLNFFKKSYFM